MPSPATPAAPPSRPLSGAKGNYTPSSVIRRGPLKDLPKRPPPDRHRFLTPRQVRELMNIEAFAEAKGTPFTAHLTLHWRCDPNFDPAEWGARTTRCFDKLGRWLDRHGIPIAFAFVHEVGVQYGEHTHCLLHLPKAKRDVIASYHALKAELEAWVIATENLATDKLDPRGRPWPPVTVTPDKPHHFGMRTAKMRGGALAYLLKGIDPGDLAYRGNGAEPRAAAMGIKPRSSTKPIEVQRYGASRTLGPKARREAGWRELTSVEEFYARLKPE